MYRDGGEETADSVFVVISVAKASLIFWQVEKEKSICVYIPECDSVIDLNKTGESRNL